MIDGAQQMGPFPKPIPIPQSLMTPRPRVTQHAQHNRFARFSPRRKLQIEHKRRGGGVLLVLPWTCKGGTALGGLAENEPSSSAKRRGDRQLEEVDEAVGGR